MVENDPSGKGKQAGGSIAVFIEPETAAHGISGLRRCLHLQQPGRECNQTLRGGQKNWRFCDGAKGAESSAIVSSLVETAKVNGIEPYTYLMRVLSMLPCLRKSPAHEELEKLTPWHPAVRQREHIQK